MLTFLAQTCHFLGLYWSTYFATIRRDGIYTSYSAGEVDMNQVSVFGRGKIRASTFDYWNNQELYDPMELQFSANWQRTMDTSIRSLLSRSKIEVMNVCDKLMADLNVEFKKQGIEARRLLAMISTSKRSAQVALDASFSNMGQVSVSRQRELTRSMLPQIQENMKQCYQAGVNAREFVFFDLCCMTSTFKIKLAGGAGRFDRIKHAMMTGSSSIVSSMFAQAMAKIKSEINSMIYELSKLVNNTHQIMRKSLENVFSSFFDPENDTNVDPKIQESARACRDALLPQLNELLSIQVEVSRLVGIEREGAELGIMQVETLDDRLKRKEEEAKESGNAFDLSGSSEGSEIVSPIPVKSDPDILPPVDTRHEPNSSRQIFDLCDSSDEDENVTETPKISSTTNCDNKIQSTKMSQNTATVFRGPSTSENQSSFIDLYLSDDSWNSDEFKPSGLSQTYPLIKSDPELEN